MINTWSKFNFGFTIDTTNSIGDFSEGGSALTATLDAQGYTLGEICMALAAALNLSGANTYTVTVSRTTHRVTIAANHNFELLLNTGDHSLVSFWELLGFSLAADLTGAATYTGTSQAGQIYYPQFLLQSYVPSNLNQQSLEPMVNRTASGRTELIRFGIDEFIEFELKFITDLAMDGLIIKNNPGGVAAAQAFLEDITTKSRFEFVPDVAHPSTFEKVVLESMQSAKDGSGFKLKELYMQNLPGIFETGIMTLRVVT